MTVQWQVNDISELADRPPIETAGKSNSQSNDVGRQQVAAAIA